MPKDLEVSAAVADFVELQNLLFFLERLYPGSAEIPDAKDLLTKAAYRLEPFNPFLWRGKSHELAWVDAADGERVPFLRVRELPRVVLG